MFSKFVRAAAAVSILALTAGAAETMWSAPAMAATDSKKVSKAVAAPLIAAQELAKANDFPGALAKVKEAQALADKTPFDDYKINEFLGFVAISMKDYELATTAYEAMAASPELPEDKKQSTFYNTAILSGQAKHYDKAISSVQQLEAMKVADEKSLAIAARSYYLLNDYANAQAYAEKSIAASKAAGKTPDQSVLEIVMSVQAKQNNQGAAQQSLEQLAVEYGDPASWGQLIDLAFSIKGMKPIDALYLQRLRYRSGAMKEAEDFTILGTLANQLGYPGEARAVLQAGIGGGKLTTGQAGDTLTKARSGAVQDERDLPTLAKAAAASKSGEQDVKMAEAYYGYGRFAEAEASARSAIAKGGTKDSSEGQMVLGQALAAQGKNDEAIEAFGKASGSEGRNKAAHLWQLYAQHLKKKAPAPAPAPAPATN